MTSLILACNRAIAVQALVVLREQRLKPHLIMVPADFAHENVAGARSRSTDPALHIAKRPNRARTDATGGAGLRPLGSQLEPLASDTAHSLYRGVLALGVDLLRRALPLSKQQKLPVERPTAAGTAHRKADLEAVRDLTARYGDLAAQVVRDLRALTTDRWSEAAFVDTPQGRILVRVQVALPSEGEAPPEEMAEKEPAS